MLNGVRVVLLALKRSIRCKRSRICAQALAASLKCLEAPGQQVHRDVEHAVGQKVFLSMRNSWLKLPRKL